MYNTINKSIKYDPEIFDDLIERLTKLNQKRQNNDFFYLPTKIYVELNRILKENNKFDTICFCYMAKPNRLSLYFTYFKLSLMNTVNKNNYKIKQFIRTLYLSLVLVIVLKNPTFLFTISYLISTLITSVVLYGFIIFWSKLIYNWFSISIQASTFVNHPHLLYISYLYINCKQSEAIKIKFKNDKYFFANKKEKYYECIVDNNNRIIELTSLDQMVEALYTIRKATYVQYVK